jgi:aminoglycoside 3-N-acetyltransferase
LSARDLTNKIKTLLTALGVLPGDTVFVHSGIGPISAMLGKDIKVSIPDALTAFHTALLETLGQEGTVAAPGFFYDYARKGKPFILETSPPDRALGFYPMHLFKEEGCKRSLNPLTSILAVGKHADEICEHTSAYAYGVTSPWARLAERDAKGLVIGLPFMMTFLHHVEALVGPPQIYNKLFRAPVIVNGEPITLPVVGAMRYLKYDISYKDDQLEAMLRREGVMTEVSTCGVKASLTRFTDIQRLLSAELSKDSSFTLAAEPNFIAGEVPDDSKW